MSLSKTTFSLETRGDTLVKAADELISPIFALFAQTKKNISLR